MAAARPGLVVRPASGSSGTKSGGAKQAVLDAFAQPHRLDRPPSSSLKLALRKTIVSAAISPKSVVSSGTGYVFAQNMMYKHTITVYDSKTLSSSRRSRTPSTRPSSTSRATAATPSGGRPSSARSRRTGASPTSRSTPCTGRGYVEGHDVCSPGSASDSYVYRVSLADLKIDKVIKVGEVPKYLAVTPDQKYLLVSNWCSYSLTVIDIHTGKMVKSVHLGRTRAASPFRPDSQDRLHRRDGQLDIAVVDLTDFSLSWISGVGSGPRHLCMAGNGKYLYATLNGEGNVAKIDPKTRRSSTRSYTGAEPRSMAIAPDGRSLFVVNYNSSTMTQVRTSDMKVIHSERTNALPIGITYDAPTRSVWLCCYSGSIMIFKQV